MGLWLTLVLCTTILPVNYFAGSFVLDVINARATTFVAGGETVDGAEIVRPL